MNKSIIFDNVQMTLEDGEVLQVMYFHKGFAIVDTGEENLSLMPLNPTEIDELLLNPLNAMSELNELEDNRTIKMLDEIVGDLDVSVERSRITG